MAITYNSHGAKAEKKTSKRLQGQLTPASGALPHAKGDFKTGGFLVENKSTNKKSLSFKLEWFRKISKEAVSQSLYPAVSTQFVDDHGNSLNGGNWVTIPEYIFKELLDGVFNTDTKD